MRNPAWKFHPRVRRRLTIRPKLIFRTTFAVYTISFTDLSDFVLTKEIAVNIAMLLVLPSPTLQRLKGAKEDQNGLKELNTMEKARAYDHALRQQGMTMAKLAAKFDISVARLCQLRALVGTRPEVQELVIAGRLDPSLAVLLSLVPAQERYTELIRRAQAGTLTRADIEQVYKPQRRRRQSASKPAQPSRRIVPVGNGCSLKLSGTVRSLGEIVGLLTEFLNRARKTGADESTDLSSIPGFLASSPTS